MALHCTAFLPLPCLCHYSPPFHLPSFLQTPVCLIPSLFALFLFFFFATHTHCHHFPTPFYTTSFSLPHLISCVLQTGTVWTGRLWLFLPDSPVHGPPLSSPPLSPGSVSTFSISHLTYYCALGAHPPLSSPTAFCSLHAPLLPHRAFAFTARAPLAKTRTCCALALPQRALHAAACAPFARAARFCLHNAILSLISGDCDEQHGVALSIWQQWRGWLVNLGFGVMGCDPHPYKTDMAWLDGGRWSPTPPHPTPSPTPTPSSSPPSHHPFVGPVVVVVVVVLVASGGRMMDSAWLAWSLMTDMVFSTQHPTSHFPFPPPYRDATSFLLGPPHLPHTFLLVVSFTTTYTSYHAVHSTGPHCLHFPPRTHAYSLHFLTPPHTHTYTFYLPPCLHCSGVLTFLLGGFGAQEVWGWMGQEGKGQTPPACSFPVILLFTCPDIF